MIFEFLRTHSIPYVRVDHPPVFTCDEADRLVPPIDGAKTKNLFLRDDTGRRHYLLTVPSYKRVDMKALSETIGLRKLSLASPERLKRYLGLEPGSVTLLGVINDQTNNVEVMIDEDLWNESAVLCHPLVNTSTLSLSRAALEKFFTLTRHEPRLVKVPSRGAG